MNGVADKNPEAGLQNTISEASVKGDHEFTGLNYFREQEQKHLEEQTHICNLFPTVKAKVIEKKGNVFNKKRRDSVDSF